MTTPTQLTAEWLHSELDFEWQRKGAFETRSLALVASNVGFVTLFFAMTEQLKLLDRLNEDSAVTGLRVALIGVAVSTVAAVISALPRSYGTVNLAVVEELVDCLFDPTVQVPDVEESLIRERLETLKEARNSNGSKAFWTFVSFVALAGAAIALVSALLLGDPTV